MDKNLREFFNLGKMIFRLLRSFRMKKNKSIDPSKWPFRNFLDFIQAFCNSKYLFPSLRKAIRLHSLETTFI